MAQEDRPLLARAESNDSIREANEEDALLTGAARPSSKEEQSRWQKYREAGLSLYALLATITIIALAIAVHRESKHQHGHRHKDGGGKESGGHDQDGRRNLIFMVSDGMGPTSLSMTRSFRQWVDVLPKEDILVLDEHLVGSSRTRS